MTTDIDYERATQRLIRITAALIVAGTVIAGLWHGVPSAVGFALGGVVSLASLWLWHGVAMKVGPPLPLQKSAGKSGPSTPFLVGRFVALFAVAYVIVKTLEVNVMAALSGLFVSAAAVIAEVLFELITFRHSRSR